MPPPALLSQLQRLQNSAELERMQPDAELLDLYIESGSREAIERLIERYAPMVASVCRLTVSDPTSAEDAFQATFLILLKSAKKIRRHASVGAWLHGVAYRTACRLRKPAREPASNPSDTDVSDYCDSTAEPMTQLARRMELEALDRELESLPDKLREPLVEHYLLGFTAPQIAERMELSTSAVEGRLKRGRRVLRRQLARRGISLSVLFAGSTLFQQQLKAAEATQWTANFVEQYLPSEGEGWEHATHDPTPPSHLSSLVRGELQMFSSSTLKIGLCTGLMLAAGTLAVVAADRPFVWNSDSEGSASSGDATGPLTLPALSPEAAVVAQFGPAVQQTTSTEQQATPAATVSTVASNASAAIAPATNTPAVVTWERADQSNTAPSWLAGGTASTQAIEQNRLKMAEMVNCDFLDLPLTEVASQLSEQLRISIDVNESELEDMGIEPDFPVTLHATCSLREALRRIFILDERRDLAYRINESNIEITSANEAAESTNMRFYDLAYILPNSANAMSVVNAIETSIAKDSWEPQGGMSTIAVVGSMMIVNAPDQTHQAIEILLVNLAKMNPANASKEIPFTNPIYGGVGGAGMGGMGGGMGGIGGGMF